VDSALYPFYRGEKTIRRYQKPWHQASPCNAFWIGLQKAIKRAAHKARIHKQTGCHTLRHSFATHLLENGHNIRVLQKLMGHADVKCTEIYTHVMNNGIDKTVSPLDTL